MKLYKASQAALKLGISKQTLLRYEKKGILPCSRRNHINSWREYSEEDLRRLKIILRRGFTMIETLMVIVIVAILAAVAVPRMEGLFAVRLSGAAKKLALDVRYVQQSAISLHANARIVFQPANEVYYAEYETPAGSNTWQALKDPLSRKDLRVDLKTSAQYSGVDIVNAVFPAGAMLVFDWQGDPGGGGSVDLFYRGNSRRVAVAAHTGQVSIQ